MTVIEMNLLGIMHVLSQPNKEDDDDNDGGKKMMVTITPCKLGQKTQMCEILLVDI
jgi:hypothetical protein